MERTLELVVKERDQDSDLVEEARAGSHAAFDLLFQRHKQFVFNICYRILGAFDDATDATQSSFIQAYNGLHAFRSCATFRTWLFRIATNVAVGMARKRKRRWTLELQDDMAAEPEDSCERVWEVILDMPVELRTVLVLFYIQGLSGEEMAEVLGCSTGAARTRLYRARQAFKKLYEEVGT